MTDKLVEIKRVYDFGHAHILRGYLESQGIYCTLFDENHNRIAWHLQIALGGIRLMVLEKDAEEARAILLNHNETIALSESEPYLPASKQGLWRSFASLIVFLASGMPMPFRKKGKTTDEE